MRCPNVRRHGYVFAFKFDEDHPEDLHIFISHGANPDDAIAAFMADTGSVFPVQADGRTLFRSEGSSHWVHWYWIDETQGVVMIVSCRPWGAAWRDAR